MAGVAKSFLQNLDEIEETPLEWAWDGLIPAGKLTLLTGASGTGKSLVAHQATSIVTRGWRPDPKPPEESPDAIAPVLVPARPRCVVVLSAEDDPDNILKPRLKAAGADTSRVLDTGSLGGSECRLFDLASRLQGTRRPNKKRV